MIIELKKVVQEIQLEGKRYLALKGIDLTIAAGQFVAVIGKSGSGHTNLIEAIAGIEAPTSGTVTVNGTDITKLQGGELEEWRRSHIGVITRNHVWDHSLTLLDNVILRMDSGGCLRSKRGAIGRLIYWHRFI